VENGDLADRVQGQQLADVLDKLLRDINCEYAGKRDSARLGPVRLELLPTGAWHTWAQERLARTGGTMEQYKHPCLIPDLGFRASMPVEQEDTVGSGIRVDAAAPAERVRHVPPSRQAGKYLRLRQKVAGR